MKKPTPLVNMQDRTRLKTQAYEGKKQELSIGLELLKMEIDTEQDKMLNVGRFLKIVGKYIDIWEITP